MKFKAVVEYEYPIEHKPPVKAEIILHGDKVITENIKRIEQEPKTGEWIDGKCSVCHENPLDYIECMGASDDAYIETPMPYCPNCGVKMKGDKKWK